MNFKNLPIANLRAHPGRSAGLGLFVALLAFGVLACALVTVSLSNGLASLEARLGADIIVAPDTAKSKANLESVLLDGTPGYFYMDRSYLDKVRDIEGVEAASPQYFLATVKASCCSMPLQIIGFDPETDFTVQPWIARSVGADLGREDVVTGCNVSGAAGSTIKVYGIDCQIVGRLDQTGTALDNALFATDETLKDLIAGSQAQGISVLSDNDPDQVISTIQVKVADGYDIKAVADYVKLYVRGVTAVQTKAMTSGVADGVSGAAGVVRGVACAFALLAFAVIVVAFSVAGRGRAREFAVLRVLGASCGSLARMIVAEAAIVSMVGALAGCACALVAIFGLGPSLEAMLGLPFLMPDAAHVAVLGVAVFVAAAAAGPLASALCALRQAKADPGASLRVE